MAEAGGDEIDAEALRDGVVVQRQGLHVGHAQGVGFVGGERAAVFISQGIMTSTRMQVVTPPFDDAAPELLSG